MAAARRETIDGVSVALTYFSKGGERMRTPHTGVAAEAHGPPSLRITVREAGILDPIGRKLGMQDVPTGSKAFDKRFIVQSNLPDGARVWLHPRLRGRLARVSGYRFKLEDGRASAEAVGIEDDAGVQDRVMKAVASLARGMQGLESAWAEVVESLDRGRVRKRVNGWLQLKGKLDGHEVLVRIRSRGDKVTTTIRTDRTTKRSADLTDPILDSMGAKIAVRRGHVVVTLPGICDDPERLLGCIEAAVGGGERRRGAYR